MRHTGGGQAAEHLLHRQLAQQLGEVEELIGTHRHLPGPISCADPRPGPGCACPSVPASSGTDNKVTMHSLRHFYASLLIRHGESVKVVQSRLGHATAAETLDTYSHLWPDSEDRTRDAVEAVLGIPADSLRTGRGG